MSVSELRQGDTPGTQDFITAQIIGRVGVDNLWVWCVWCGVCSGVGGGLAWRGVAYGVVSGVWCGVVSCGSVWRGVWRVV